jgi:hypothetical protein
MRTAAVLIGAILISVAAHTLLGHLLSPDSEKLIVRMFTTPANSKEWTDLARQWHRFNSISLFVATPLGSIAAGLFVGFLQKHNVALVAAICQIPEFAVLLWVDHAKNWEGSLQGYAYFLGVRSLPFITAIATAMLCQRLLSSRQHHRLEPAV